MSDPFRSNESGDMSSFLQILLQSSSLSPPNHGGDSASGSLFCGGGIVEGESSSSINFSDPTSFFPGGESERINSSSVEKHGALPRSSKRTRAAEFHNLSEKRRRSRINEKLKALQTLIPNSNKADKATMLDEAIEYLKQLQLQVQMLTVRNGLSLNPGYSLTSLQSMLSSSSMLEFRDGTTRPNSNRLPDPLSTDHDETNGVASSTRPAFMTSMPNTTSSGAIPGFMP